MPGGLSEYIQRLRITGYRVATAYTFRDPSRRRIVRNVFWITFFLFTLSMALLAQQSPQLKRMSTAELATSTHDLEHDLTNGQTRIDQYRSKLNPSYRLDSQMLKMFDLLDRQIKQLRSEIKDLSSKDSLANDVSLYSSLEDVTSTLDSVSAMSADAPSMNTLASPEFRDVGDVWANTVVDVKKEIGVYTVRFFSHALASASLADLMLDVCHADQPKKTTK
jgi:hypothetical protein